ncbi:MAG: helix-turn-helix domain-containing protein [Lysobacterales bacterium]
MLTKDRLIRLCQARDQLRDVGECERSVADIANAAAMSQFHFIRQFRAVFGETPGQFRIRSRLNKAKHLLARGEHSVTDVCMAVGFSSLGSFSTLFAARFGQPPSAYRRRLAGAGDQLQPHCMDLLLGAWKSNSQFSRSDDQLVGVNCGSDQQHGKAK